MGKVVIVDDTPPALEAMAETIRGVGRQFGLEQLEFEKLISVQEALAFLENDPQGISLMMVDTKLGENQGSVDPDLLGTAILDYLYSKRSPLLKRTVLYSSRFEETLLSDEQLLQYASFGVQDILPLPLTDELIIPTFLKCFGIEPPAPRRDEIEARLGQEVFEGIIGESKALRKVLDGVSRVAKSDDSVLIIGESGTGKELIASAVHMIRFPDDRNKDRFVPLNIAQLATTDAGLALRGELFGIEQGVLGGGQPRQYQPGVFERAQGGTVFLDEIGEISGEACGMLLRSLEEKTVEPFGGAVKKLSPFPRLICATDRPLSSDVARGAFDDALYHRIATEEILLPPFRNREFDAILVAENRFRELNRPDLRLSWGAKACLLQHRLPGNGRTISSICSRIVNRRPSNLGGLISRQEVENVLPITISGKNDGIAKEILEMPNTAIEIAQKFIDFAIQEHGGPRGALHYIDEILCRLLQEDRTSEQTFAASKKSNLISQRLKRARERLASLNED